MNSNSNQTPNGAKDVILFIILFIFALFMVLPLIWLASASLQGLSGLSKYPFNWIPEDFKFVNFYAIWTKGQLQYAFISSVITALLYLLIHLTVCTAAGYVFAKYKFRYKNFLFSIILVTMMIPQELTFFPVYDIVKRLHAINTYPGLILPIMISGFGVFFMRQFATYIPNELLECAKIDGSGNIRTFVRIAIPLMKPAISSLAILAFTYIWDEFAWARIAVSVPKMRTLPIVLATLANSSFHEVEQNELIAGGLLTVIPVIVLFLIFQKQFIESVAYSGIKG